MSDVSGFVSHWALTCGVVTGAGAHESIPLEQRGAASCAVLVAMAAQLATPAGFGLNPSWLLPVVAGGLVLIIAIGGRYATDPAHPTMRFLALCLAAVLALGNLGTVVLLVRSMLAGEHIAASGLFAVGGIAWLTNVVAFAVALWEVDAGGPVARSQSDVRRTGELLFAQYSLPGRERWAPRFADYLYVSLTNATAFSPTDTLPLTVRAKLLMAGQSCVALVAVAVVFARGVNIIGA